MITLPALTSRCWRRGLRRRGSSRRRETSSSYAPRLPMNQTPLMAAAAAGNVPLVEALLERGADREAVDHYGGNALHWALREAFRDPQFARGPLAAHYELLAPASLAA